MYWSVPVGSKSINEVNRKWRFQSQGARVGGARVIYRVRLGEGAKPMDLTICGRSIADQLDHVACLGHDERDRSPEMADFAAARVVTGSGRI